MLLGFYFNTEQERAFSRSVMIILISKYIAHIHCINFPSFPALQDVWLLFFISLAWILLTVLVLLSLTLY